MPTDTNLNWNALKRLAGLHLHSLHRDHPDWCLEDLHSALSLPRTALLSQMLRAAGFVDRQEPTLAEITAVAAQCFRGARSASTIGLNTGLPKERVQAILQAQVNGYGCGPYGRQPYGGNRKCSNGQSTVPRRVSDRGQLSYRGFKYTMGTVHRGQTVLLREEGQAILVRFQDGAEARMTRRRYLSR